MERFARGSEWRKWDLHVHAPITAMANGYPSIEGEDPIDTFARRVEASDVAVLGVTDYFNLATSVKCITRFHELFPESAKLLLPNMELRLQVVVNSQGEEVNAHLVFRDDLTKTQAEDFMRALLTESTADGNRTLTVKEAVDLGRHESIVVSRASVDDAYDRVFGRSRPRDAMLIITPCRGGGIRPARSGAQRKHAQAAELDRWSDAIFGGHTNRDFFLDPMRAEAEGIEEVPKPVFSGSDSHSWDDLDHRLGSAVGGDRPAEITWVKADPTFDGLLQTLVEPSERVRIQSTRPDQKEPYQIIRSVRFTGTTDFPEEIPFNQNLVSVIGTRSSGKSALLAYIAHAVDPEHTIRQQVAVGIGDAREVGPAAGIPWSEVADIHCEVEWGDDAAEQGQVIFIPQNSLFALSTRPQDITNKIRPVLYRQAPAIAALHQRIVQEMASINTFLRESVASWFDVLRSVAKAEEHRKVLGERPIVEASIRSAETAIVELRSDSGLDDDEAADAYEELLGRINDRQIATRQIDEQRARLQPWLDFEGPDSPRAVNVEASLTTTPRSHELPPSVRDRLDAAVTTTEQGLATSLAVWIVEADVDLKAARSRIEEDDASDRAANQQLMDLNAANDALQELLDRVGRQKATLAEIDGADTNLDHLRSEQANAVAKIRELLSRRDDEIDSFRTGFADAAPTLDDLSFGIEVGIADGAIAAVSQALDLRRASSFVENDTRTLNLAEARSEPGAFLEALGSNRLALKTGHRAGAFAAEALATSEEIRFLAHLQGDRIGGFAPATMTPGKQALFALTLILNETDVRWPILIDQPEDDLDSRSIYGSIVPFLKERKRERQIIMVSHNANLVVGADSEQVIVANRHGDDRPNRTGRGFEYLGGSLEHSHDDPSAEFTLEMHGIREHACALLDGGEEAFRKRRDIYRMAR